MFRRSLRPSVECDVQRWRSTFILETPDAPGRDRDNRRILVILIKQRHMHVHINFLFMAVSVLILVFDAC